MASHGKSQARFGRAFDEVDAVADFTVTYEGEQVRLDQVPHFFKCQMEWANAKSRRASFGWTNFVAFFQEMIEAIPQDGRMYRFVVIDRDRPFVRDNLRWEPDTWLDP